MQKELNLSPEQVKQVADQLAKQPESLGSLRDLGREERVKKLQEQNQANNTAIAGILKEDQLKRFKQIALQQNPGQAFTESEVVEKLSLTAEQKDKIASIQGEAATERRSLFGGGGGGGGANAERRQKMEALNKATTEKLQNVLTPEQQTKWKELVGEPFKGEIRRPQVGGNRGAGANLAPIGPPS